MPNLLNATRYDASGTVGTQSTVALPANTSRLVLELQNVSTNSLGFTTDGTPAVLGNPGTFTLAAGQGYNPPFVPTGQINVVGSGVGTAYTLKWA